MTEQHPPAFEFIDLFAGIGGLRIGLESIGGECVFSSEWDKFAQQTYEAWHGERPAGDITQIDPHSVPDHDILAAGFPCQPFSIAGVSKKISLGRAHGFADVKQGNLFFALADVVRAKKPSVLLLENVKNLRSHDRGKTWEVIQETLDKLGYEVHAQIIDAAGWVPQHRERIFIVGFRRDIFSDVFPEGVPFEFPTGEGGHQLQEILEEDVDSKYTLSNKLWAYLQNYALKHKAKGNGFGFGLPALDGISRTLSARYHKDGSEILIRQGDGRNPRRLTPLEAGRLMGFPVDDPKYGIVVSDTQAYRQFGNAVVPKVASAVARQIEIVNELAADAGTDWKSTMGADEDELAAS
ncbi:DNA (cytosine-5-)-methyltransferase [Janibacter anophelis]|uniref:DNA (cytosine-5-)-methyltransferase n=1 Tax=Janibacter anophelis TaxID=319054 RepID=UPI0008360035|nr:DNA (cytosine-5-)-methyltransferase [Janibacter anophelis]